MNTLSGATEKRLPFHSEIVRSNRSHSWPGDQENKSGLWSPGGRGGISPQLITTTHAAAWYCMSSNLKICGHLVVHALKEAHDGLCLPWLVTGLWCGWELATRKSGNFFFLVIGITQISAMNTSWFLNLLSEQDRFWMGVSISLYYDQIQACSISKPCSPFKEEFVFHRFKFQRVFFFWLLLVQILKLCCPLQHSWTAGKFKWVTNLCHHSGWESKWGGIRSEKQAYFYFGA